MAKSQEDEVQYHVQCLSHVGQWVTVGNGLFPTTEMAYDRYHQLKKNHSLGNYRVLAVVIKELVPPPLPEPAVPFYRAIYVLNRDGLKRVACTKELDHAAEMKVECFDEDTYIAKNKYHTTLSGVRYDQIFNTIGTHVLTSRLDHQDAEKRKKRG